MQDIMLGLITAVGGATVGALITWAAQMQQEHDRAQRTLAADLQAKLHQLELRIVKLEAENHAFIVTGARNSPDPEAGDA